MSSENTKNFAVFCGSRFGVKPEFKRVAEEIGAGLAQRDLTLVYGGGAEGLMGVVADAALQAGGRVHGVMPEFLHATERLHDGVQKMELTPDMLTRKARLYELSDAYIILPGGIGTLDEFSDVLVAAQLEQESKPIYVINVSGWIDPLLEFFKTLKESGFVGKPLSDFFSVFDSAQDFFAYLDR